MLINGREYTDNVVDTNLFDLTSYLGVIVVSGENSLEFLQGQLTADIKSLTQKISLPSALCNLQGRIIALLDLVLFADNICLIMPQDMLAIVYKELAMPAKFSRVKLAMVPDILVFGYQGDVPQDYDAYHLYADCYYILSAGNNSPTIPSSRADNLSSSESNPSSRGSSAGSMDPAHKAREDGLYAREDGLYAREDGLYARDDESIEPCNGSLAWHSIAIANYRFSIYPNSSGLFLPHHLDLHKTQYLNFHKGCYKGQEIIARMHYKARAKYGLLQYKQKTADNLQIGHKLDAKEIVDFAPYEGGYIVLSIVPVNNS
jgi:tRNA-modifying protein YgfZ